MEKMKYILLLLTITIVSCNSHRDKMIKENTSVEETYRKGELIVVFDNKEDYNITIKTLEKYKEVSLIKMLMITDSVKIAHFKVPIKKEKEFIDIFEKLPNVKSAELNFLGSFN